MKRLASSILVLAACGGPPSAHSPEADGAIIFFDVPGKRLPFPMVRGTVAGRPTNLIVDTGAQISVVAEWFAKRAALVTVETAAAEDPAGNPVPMLRADHAPIAIDGVGAFPDGPVSVIELPPAFEQFDIGAIISPQALAPVVIDLPRRRMSRTPLGPVHGVPLERVRICPYESGGLSARSLVGEGVVDGVPLKMEIDTGAEQMLVVSDSAAARKLSARPNPKSGAATGAAGRFTVQSYVDIPVQIGSWSTIAWVTVAPGKKQEPCGYEGRMSIQELNACVFVIGTNDLHITCER